MGLETDRARAAEAQVQVWHDASTLPFPEFAQEVREEIEYSLDNPPAGSPAPGRSEDEGDV